MAIFKFGKPAEQPPEGMYGHTELVEVKKVDGKFGAQLRGTFKVSAGDHEGKVISQWAPIAYEGEPVVPRMSNKLGRLLSNLAGRPIDSEEEVDPEDFVGGSYTIVVKSNGDGKAMIDSVVRNRS